MPMQIIRMCVKRLAIYRTTRQKVADFDLSYHGLKCAELSWIFFPLTINIGRNFMVLPRPKAWKKPTLYIDFVNLKFSKILISPHLGVFQKKSNFCSSWGFYSTKLKEDLFCGFNGTAKAKKWLFPFMTLKTKKKSSLDIKRRRRGCLRSNQNREKRQLGSKTQWEKQEECLSWSGLDICCRLVIICGGTWSFLIFQAGQWQFKLFWMEQSF